MEWKQNPATRKEKFRSIRYLGDRWEVVRFRSPLSPHSPPSDYLSDGCPGDSELLQWARSALEIAPWPRATSMELSTRKQRLAAAQFAVGLWLFVAATVACVTWSGPRDANRIDLANASWPVVALTGTYLSVTAFFHLGISARLRQERGLRAGGILTLTADHWAILAMVAQISLRNPASPVYLTGSEILLAVLGAGALVSLVASLMCWLVAPEAFARRPVVVSLESEPTSDWSRRILLGGAWLHIAITLGLLFALWRLDMQPLQLVK